MKQNLKFSKKIADTLDVFNCCLFSGQCDVLGVLVQDSLRYEKMKRFAVYNEGNYIGNYECIEVVNYSFYGISDALCKLLWCKLKADSMNELRSIISKGRFSEKSNYKFITLMWVGETKAYKIKSKLKL